MSMVKEFIIEGSILASLDYGDKFFDKINKDINDLREEIKKNKEEAEAAIEILGKEILELKAGINGGK